MAGMESELDDVALERFGTRAHEDAHRLIGRVELLDVIDPDGDYAFTSNEEYCEWREANPDAPIGPMLVELAATWDHPTTYDESILEEAALRERLDVDEHFDVDFYQAVFVLDVSVVTMALAHLVVTGRLDADAKRIAQLAVRRQLHPLVLTRLYGDESDLGTMSRDLEDLLKVFC